MRSWIVRKYFLLTIFDLESPDTLNKVDSEKSLELQASDRGEPQTLQKAKLGDHIKEEVEINKVLSAPCQFKSPKKTDAQIVKEAVVTSTKLKEP